MSTIRLFVCCHRPSPVPPQPLLVPIQVGAALAGQHFPGWLHDDEGDNISRKNRAYCELTAQYWAWKNDDADYVGFFHYRRYLYPDTGARRPYRVVKRLSVPLLKRMGYDRFPALIEGHDLIVPLAEEMHVSVREHYAAAPHHRAEDLALMENILRARCPDYAEAAERYLSGTRQLFGNLFIMRREVFEHYCAWLFPLLEDFDRRAALSGRSAQEQRVDGYLAERLLGIYCARHAAALNTLALPRLHLHTGADYWRNRLLYALLPPGSHRRHLVKQGWRRRHG